MWASVEKVLQSLDFSWCNHDSTGGSGSLSNSGTKSCAEQFIVLISDIPECLSVRRQHNGSMTGRIAASGNHGIVLHERHSG